MKRSLKPIARKGKRGRANDKAHLKARLDYFKNFAFQGCDKTDWCAHCQICGGPMGWAESCACHKLDASLSGAEEAENYLIGHFHCNGATDLEIEMKKEMRASETNATTGGQIQWTTRSAERLRGYLRKCGVSWLGLLSLESLTKSTNDAWPLI